MTMDARQTPVPAASLTITVRDSPEAPLRQWRLTCGPPGGDHPAPGAACAALASADTPFQPVPPGRLCAQVYGGPQLATIEGTWQGTAVRAEYSRVNACEIARWNALAPVFQDSAE